MDRDELKPKVFCWLNAERLFFGANPGCLHERVSIDPALLLISRAPSDVSFNLPEPGCCV